MTAPSSPRRQGAAGWRRAARLSALVLVLAAGSGLGAGAGVQQASASPQRLAQTGGCRAVGGGASSGGGGPNRATVVVDTGAGAVWSACVSFSGSISGIEALTRAEDVITDLDPVFDQYAGIGKAVCRLRGVGTDPPDCLGKSVDYWSYSHNGRVASVGAGAVTVHDGDIDGWRYGTGGKPRAATVGTEATAAPPTTTTTRPVTAPTQRPTGGSGGMSGSTLPGGSAPAGIVPSNPTASPGGGTATTQPGASTSTTKASASTSSSTTTPPSGDGDGTEAAASGAGAGQAASKAASGSGSASGGGGGAGSGGSPVGSILGFAAVIAAVGGGAVVLRRRRTVGTAAPA